MHFLYKRAAIEELELLVKTRIEVLRAANRLDSSVGLQEVEEHTRRYYKESLQNGQHIALLVFKYRCGDRRSQLLSSDADLSEPLREESLYYEYVHYPSLPQKRHRPAYVGSLDAGGQ